MIHTGHQYASVQHIAIHVRVGGGETLMMQLCCFFFRIPASLVLKKESKYLQLENLLHIAQSLSSDPYIFKFLANDHQLQHFTRYAHEVVKCCIPYLDIS